MEREVKIKNVVILNIDLGSDYKMNSKEFSTLTAFRGCFGSFINFVVSLPGKSFSMNSSLYFSGRLSAMDGLSIKKLT